MALKLDSSKFCLVSSLFSLSSSEKCCEAASATLPAPASTQNIRLPDLSKSKFEANQLLNVEGFKEMRLRLHRFPFSL